MKAIRVLVVAALLAVTGVAFAATSGGSDCCKDCCKECCKPPADCCKK